MKLYTAFAIVIVYISVPTYGANPSNKVKVTGYETVYVDKEYFNPSNSKAQVIYVNETFNKLALSVEELKDAPNDVELDIKVRRSKKNNDDWKQVAHYNIHPCDQNDKNRKYLANFMLSLTETGKCFPMGNYSTNDGGIFRFYDLLPAKEIDGYYFATIMSLKLYNGNPINLYVIRSQSINVK